MSATPDDLATWAAFAAAAPDLARRVRERFAANRHHVIGTIRPSGAPRLSGTEVDVRDDDVVIGMMPASRKLADVRRDPRVEVHSAPLEEDLAGGDAKLGGVLVELDAAPPDSPDGAFFSLRLELVSLVQVEGEELVVTSWRPARGVTTTRRR